ncbi:MAG: excinuclease ABC subunit UvrC [Gammaproteobacteria bacterium]|nr:excinuclease ABC subunit UvrC [Gammaproteobacteria bacterium]
MTSFNSSAFVKALSAAPGVYRMLGARGEVLYVGKARNLRRRVSSYFRATGLPTRTQVMMRLVHGMEVTVTHTESEALLLENNLIKSLRPRYNIVLRDDKSYPYIFLSDHLFPRLAFHRGAKREKGRYFGPFPSAFSVRESLNLLQKVFPVRQCEDSFFRNRSRPCLQYQIKRCSAPCVGYIDAVAYAEDVRHAALFLEGESQTLIGEMVARMEEASQRQEYELAARYRDRIAALRRIQERQAVSGESGDADVLAVVADQDAACVVVTFIRSGRNLGNKNFFPKIGGETDPQAILDAFLPQYYLGKPVPAAIYLNRPVTDRGLLEAAFAQESGHAVQVIANPRGLHRRWVRLAELNARDGLRRFLSDQASLHRRFEALQEALALDALPERIECFDISHTMGEATVASCVVFTPDGPLKSDYRRFNIENVAAGDDYAAIAQALTRRYRRALEHNEEDGGRLPDLVLIDGGKGQLGAAQAAMRELSMASVRLVAVAKGRERKPGREQLFLSGRRGATILPAHSSALHLIQQIRDEAHRFAITGHRQRRGRARNTSTLESIPGIGNKRRQALLRNLGGLQEVARAGIEDLVRVPGISPGLARRIYEMFHDNGAKEA